MLVQRSTVPVIAEVDQEECVPAPTESETEHAAEPTEKPGGKKGAIAPKSSTFERRSWKREGLVRQTSEGAKPTCISRQRGMNVIYALSWCISISGRVVLVTPLCRKLLLHIRHALSSSSGSAPFVVEKPTADDGIRSRRQDTFPDIARSSFLPSGRFVCTMSFSPRFGDRLVLRSL